MDLSIFYVLELSIMNLGGHQDEKLRSVSYSIVTGQIAWMCCVDSTGSILLAKVKHSVPRKAIFKFHLDIIFRMTFGVSFLCYLFISINSI